MQLIPRTIRLMRGSRFLPLLALVACGQLKELPTEPGGTPDSSATFTRVQNEIFTPTCAVVGCHDAIGQQQGQILTAGQSYSKIVGVQSTEMPSLNRVAPGDPANSYLYRKVTGSGIVGERMPLGSAPLSDQQLSLLRDWIRRGAPND